MKHAASRELYAYWDERRGTTPGARSAPRSSPAPSAMCSATPSSSALDVGAGHPFRLAGTRVCALFGRELKGEAFIGAVGGGKPADHRRSA